MIINLLGIDIAKNVFQPHGVDSNGKAVLKKTTIKKVKAGNQPKRAA